jgi:hypothetical protein
LSPLGSLILNDVRAQVFAGRSSPRHGRGCLPGAGQAADQHDPGRAADGSSQHNAAAVSGFTAAKPWPVPPPEPDLRAGVDPFNLTRTAARYDAYSVNSSRPSRSLAA